VLKTVRVAPKVTTSTIRLILLNPLLLIITNLIIMMKSSLRSTDDEKKEQNRNTDDKGNGKTVLITGCSEGGIGSALAFAFHRHGCRVFATARNLEKVQHLKNAGIEILELDVLDKVSCKKAAQWVEKATGGTLNVLVNNSGVGM
jgi:1-acylglycerone phosphate reductase